MIDQGSSEINIIIGVDEQDFEKSLHAIYNEFVKQEAYLSAVGKSISFQNKDWAVATAQPKNHFIIPYFRVAVCPPLHENEDALPTGRRQHRSW